MPASSIDFRHSLSGDTDRTLGRLLERAIAARLANVDPSYPVARRLFNGPLEGYPALSIELFGKTVILYDQSQNASTSGTILTTAASVVRAKLPEVRAIVVKKRRADTAAKRKGRLIFGTEIDDRIYENGVWYAFDPFLNQDASFYLDTRYLRRWLQENVAGQSVLNTFAYTGSLGVAAVAGGASRVVQTDRTKSFLEVAKASCALNAFPVRKRDFQRADFWSFVNRLKRERERFDCVILDPPFFSTTKRNSFDLSHDMNRLINKVRPLVRHGGTIVAVNNALYLSGQAYLDSIRALCSGGYVQLSDRIPVPEDSIGYPHTLLTAPIKDPAPFNHSTKIVVLRILHAASVRSEDTDLPTPTRE